MVFPKRPKQTFTLELWATLSHTHTMVLSVQVHVYLYIKHTFSCCWRSWCRVLSSLTRTLRTCRNIWTTFQKIRNISVCVWWFRCALRSKFHTSDCIDWSNILNVLLNKCVNQSDTCVYTLLCVCVGPTLHFSCCSWDECWCKFCSVTHSRLSLPSALKHTIHDSVKTHINYDSPDVCVF